MQCVYAWNMELPVGRVREPLDATDEQDAVNATAAYDTDWQRVTKFEL